MGPQSAARKSHLSHVVSIARPAASRTSDRTSRGGASYSTAAPGDWRTRRGLRASARRDGAVLVRRAAIIGLALLATSCGRGQAEQSRQYPAGAIVPAGELFDCHAIMLWDGDGPFLCAEGPRIRLSGVAAREMDGTCRGNQPCPAASAEAARDYLEAILSIARQWQGQADGCLVHLADCRGPFVPDGSQRLSGSLGSVLARSSLLGRGERQLTTHVGHRNGRFSRQ
jgi:endonuclease YncB( thermonuclease family)